MLEANSSLVTPLPRYFAGASTLAPVFLLPLAIMGVGYMCAFGALWMVATRAEVWRRRASSLALQAAFS